jgi:hypothetical protein
MKWLFLILFSSSCSQLPFLGNFAEGVRIDDSMRQADEGAVEYQQRIQDRHKYREGYEMHEYEEEKRRRNALLFHQCKIISSFPKFSLGAQTRYLTTR